MVAIRDLDEEQISPKDSRKKMKRKNCSEGERSRAGENKLTQDNNSLPSCIDKLRDELSCAICLEICYEPTSLWCGHSFCIRCLRLAVIKFGNKCPKCQRLIRKSRPYIVNTVVWNTIQLLFPQEVKKVKSPLSNMVVVPEKQQISPKDSGKKMKKKKYSEGEGSRAVENKLTQESNSLPSCIDKLREELSCPICLELLVEPVSTWCGHSFCCGCLHSAFIKYGDNCPNCRQLVSATLSYNMNTAILNTIDLLFLQEVEARMDALNNEYLTTYHGKHIRFEQEE